MNRLLLALLLASVASAQEAPRSDPEYTAEAAKGRFTMPVTIMSIHEQTFEHRPPITDDGGTGYCYISRRGQTAYVNCGNVNLAPVMVALLSKKENKTVSVVKFEFEDNRSSVLLIRCESNCLTPRRWDDPIDRGTGKYMARPGKKRGYEILEKRDGKFVVSKWIGIAVQ
jgi:hypothetical protein